MPASFTTWIVGASTTAALAIGGWGLLGTVSNSERIAVVETNIRRLERIEDKLDWLIGEQIKDYRSTPRAREIPEAPREFPEAPKRAPQLQKP